MGCKLLRALLKVRQFGMSFNLSPFQILLPTVTTLLTVTVLATTAAASQVAPRSVNFSSLETESFHLLPCDKCRADYTKMKFDNSSVSSVLSQAIDTFSSGTEKDGSILDWTPTAALHAPNRPDCTAERLEQLMLFSKGNTSIEGEEISTFIHNCGPHLKRNGNSSLWALVKLLNVQYPLCENPNIRKVVVQLADKTVLRGFLALKPGREKRPLVIFRCGIFCSSGDSSDRVMLMHLFDEGPYNVLTVANMTGADFVRDNGYIAMSGLDEGRQLIELGQLIRNSPLNRFVSSMHMVGISLGGQGIFYAAQMNDANLWQDGKPLYASALAISSVVDLQESVNDLFNNPWKGRLARSLFFSEIKEVVTALPGIGRIFSNPAIAPNQIPSAVAQQAFLHYSMLDRKWLMKPYQDAHMYNVNEYWAMNDFARYLNVPMRTPLLALAAEDDAVVNTEHNTSRLVTALGTNPRSNLAAITIPNGTHGAFGLVYGWDIAGTLLRTHILNHSPEFAKFRSNGYTPVPTHRIRAESHAAEPGETHSQQTYNFKVGRASLRVKFQIFTHDADDCAGQSPYAAGPQCYRESVSEIPFAELPGDTPWAYVPRNTTEAAALTRWANRNLIMLSRQGAPITGTDSDGAALKWTAYGE